MARDIALKTVVLGYYCTIYVEVFLALISDTKSCIGRFLFEICLDGF